MPKDAESALRMAWNYLKALPTQTKISSAILVAANLSTVVGVFLLGWRAESILLTYWAENAVIGFFTVVKMGMARGEPAAGDVVTLSSPKGVERKPATREILIPFFLLHFGLFMLAHLFVLAASTGLIDEVLEKGIYGITIDFTLLGLLFASHGTSFATNFVGRKELQAAPPSQFFFAPYPRVIIMHLAVMFSVFAGLSVVVLVLLKTLFDLAAHIFEHQEFGKPWFRMGAGGFAAVK